MVFVTRRPLDTGDNSQDFAVQLNSIMPMIWAYKSGSPSFSMHDNRGVWSLALGRDRVLTDVFLDKTELLRNPEYEEHGLWMWGAWFVAGLGLLVTKRYIKKYWMPMQLLHTILGTFVLVVTIIFALSVLEWSHTTQEVHNTLGSIFLFVAIFGALSGYVTGGMMRFYNKDKAWSPKEKAMVVAKIHRYFGYTMLLLGNITLMTGIGHYYNGILDGDSRKVLGPLSLVVFVLLVAIFEAIYRLRNRYALGQIQTSKRGEKSQHSFTMQEVNQAVAGGQKLYIFDNLVLDIGDFTHLHPGGKFNLTHNIGRDISKFFNGGYVLVNGQGNKPYTHSMAALDIVKTMVVGVIEGQEAVVDGKFTITDKRQVNSDTSTFTFAAEQDQPILNLKSWYSNPNMIGRHFLVYSANAPRVKRHYTICSAMGR